MDETTKPAGPAPEILARIEGPQGELRLERRYYEGHRFYWLQRWTGQGSYLRPDPKRGLSIKNRELGPLIAALVDAQRADGGADERAAGARDPERLQKFHAKQDRRKEPTR
jgi:hypothetical protein